MTDCGLKRRLSLIANPARRRGSRDADRRPGQAAVRGRADLRVPSEMPSYDGHREGPSDGSPARAALQHAVVGRPNDRTGTKIVSDLAES